MTIAFVNAGQANTGSHISLNNTYAPTAGNLLIVAAGGFLSGSAPTFTLTDTRGNTIPSPTTATSLAAGPGHSALSVWLIPNCIGGAGHFTVTSQSTSSDLNLDVYEFSGASLTGVLDGTPAAASTQVTNTTLNSGNITTSVAGSLLISLMYDQSNADASVTNSLAGATQWILNNTNSGVETSSGAGNVSNAASTYSNTVTLPTSSIGFHVHLIGIQAAGGGGASVPAPMYYRKNILYFI